MTSVFLSAVNTGRSGALWLLLLCLCCLPAQAARQMEQLDRGVVALPSGSGILVSWRMLGTDPDSIAFNVYRNGSKLNSAPITTSTNYLDASGSTSAAYTVRPVLNGVELPANPAKATWANPYWTVNLNRPAGGTTKSGEAYTYSPNDLSVGDLDGDGQYEIIVKWDPSNAKDNSQSGYTGNVYVDAYKLDGTQLWRIDLGINIRAGAHYTQFIVYDLDGDGKAEIAMKTAPGTRDGKGNVQGGSNANSDYRNSSGYVLSGAEYLTIFNGETGEAMATTDYLPARGSVSSWGDSYGNRVDRFLAGVAYLDGQRPSLVMARGYYTRAVLVAWDWRNGNLARRWTFDSNSSGNSAAAGQGAHSLTIGDVDDDGRDEIIYGAAAIDHDGSLMYSTRLGHGDALHLGDFNPNRLGLEVFMVHETPSAYGEHGVEMHDAKTGQILWSHDGTKVDIGRGVTMDVDPRYPGSESWASRGGLYAADGTLIGSSRPSAINFGVWWDGDLLREQLDGENNNANGRDARIDKWDYLNSRNTTLFSAASFGARSNNTTKATPGITADLFGDWREEVIWRHENNSQLLIFATPYATEHRLRTLMHDSQYRVAIAWQNVAYNQPPHPSFFLGAGMAPPPAPDIYLVGSDPNGDSTPQLVLDGRAGNGEVALSWIASGDIRNLEIYQDTDDNPAGRTRIASLGAGVRSYSATGLSNGTPYWFWVKYTDSNGTAYNSNAFAATPLAAANTSSSASPGSSAASSSAQASSSSAGAPSQLPLTETFTLASGAHFFTSDYRALASSGEPFYHRLSGNPVFENGALWLAGARFSLGNTLPAQQTTSSDSRAYGELDLRQPYRISFCLLGAEVTGDNKRLLVYVDNNTTAGANSYLGAASVLLAVAVDSLTPGQRIVVDANSASANSFIQLRSESGASVLMDDLWLGYQNNLASEPSAHACAAKLAAGSSSAASASSAYASSLSSSLVSSSLPSSAVASSAEVSSAQHSSASYAQASSTPSASSEISQSAASSDSSALSSSAFTSSSVLSSSLASSSTISSSLAASSASLVSSVASSDIASSVASTGEVSSSSVAQGSESSVAESSLASSSAGGDEPGAPPVSSSISSQATSVASSVGSSAKSSVESSVESSVASSQESSLALSSASDSSASPSDSSTSQSSTSQSSPGESSAAVSSSAAHTSSSATSSAGSRSGGGGGGAMALWGLLLLGLLRWRGRW